MGSEETRSYFRWYDAYPNLKKLMVLIEDLPRLQQKSVSTQLLAKVLLYQEMVELNTHLKCLGMDTIMALHKSKRKLRWYDHIPELHESLNILRGFTMPVLTHFDAKCASIVSFIEMQQKRAVMLNTLDSQAIFEQRQKRRFAGSVDIQLNEGKLISSR